MELDIESLIGGFEDLKKPKVEEEKIQHQTQEFNEKCIDCGSFDVVVLSGEVICRSCGSINDTIIDSHAEWRFYGSEDSKYSDPTRCGLPTNELLPQSSLGSTIGFRPGESFAMRKIRNYHLWNAMPYRERALYNVFYWLLYL